MNKFIDLLKDIGRAAIAVAIIFLLGNLLLGLD